MKDYRYIRIIPKETFVPYPPAIYSVKWANELKKNEVKKQGWFYSYEYAPFGLVIDYKYKWLFYPAYIIELIKGKYIKHLNYD